MALESVDVAPSLADFMLLSEHQQTTPGTFFGGKPVLHLHSPGADVRIARADIVSQPTLSALLGATSVRNEVEEEETIKDIDAWISSSYLTLFSTTKDIGVQISYHSITMHAQDGNAVLLGLNLSDSNTADEDIVFIQLRITPTRVESYATPAEDDTQKPNGDSSATTDPSRALFKAIADCQELNPDPPEEGDEEFDETAPGASGWITSENMQDFVDENGEFRMPEGVTTIGDATDHEEDGTLGEGAGRARTAADVDAEDGAEDETKWRRTG